MPQIAKSRRLNFIVDVKLMEAIMAYARSIGLDVTSPSAVNEAARELLRLGLSATPLDAVTQAASLRAFATVRQYVFLRFRDWLTNELVPDLDRTFGAGQLIGEEDRGDTAP